MTPGAFALQVLAIGGQQVWHVAWVTLMWAVLGTALTVVLWGTVRPGRWIRELRRAYRERYERPAPRGCDWCDDRLPAGKCDCTGDCGRWCCMAGKARADAAIEREIDEMVRRYRRG